MDTSNETTPSTVVALAIASLASPAAQVSAGLRQWLERTVKGTSAAVGQRYLCRLPQATLSESMSAVPERLQRASRQSRLLLELLDDVRSGAYRELNWYSLPLAAGAVLYKIHPADVVPDVPIVGWFDDSAVLAMAMHFLQEDLRAYCRFKGYSEVEYFELTS